MSAAVLKSNQPIQFGGGTAGSSVTLKFSSQPGSSAAGNTLYRKPGYHAPFRPSNYPADILMGDGPGRRLRKNVANVRRHVDYVSNILNHYETRLWQYGKKQRIIQQPDELYQNTALPAWCTPEVPVDCILTKFVRAAMNKVKCPVYSLCWTPEGKRLITGASTGEFTLWNGTAFNFETILQAHDSAIRAMTWSHNQQWLISGDHDGYIKYWQPNMNNVHMYQAHKEDPIRGLSFAPTDVKLVSASDDGTVRVWDFARCAEERILRGHGSEVRCVDWHPQKGLIVSGSRDSQQPVKLWDPKSGQCLSTIQDHKSSVMSVAWNLNGNWLLTAGRDHLIKLYDIRIMKEMHTYRGHKKEVTSLAWNPVHENLFVSGGGDGSIAYWLVGTEKEVGLLEHAHDQAIWAMQFHPKGHILSTGSNDNNTKFWARNRPGDTQEDIFGLASFNTNMVGALDKEREPKASHIRIDEETILASAAIPGMGLDDGLMETMNRDITNPTMPSSANMLLIPEDLNSRRENMMQNNRRILLKQPPPKKAQRQFERMWNVSKPGAAGGDDGPPHHEDDPYRRPKASLLGNPLPSMLGNQHGGFPPNMLNGRPPAGPPPPQWNTQNMPPGMPNMPPNMPPNMQQGPPPQGLSREAFVQDMPPPQRNNDRMPPPFEHHPFPQGPPPPHHHGMPPPAGMWPPPQGGPPPNMPPPRGMPPPQMQQMQQQRDDRQDDRGRDIDYRAGPSPMDRMGSDIDFRSGPPPNIPRSSPMHHEMQGGPPPSNNENWRSDQGPSNPSMNDPRLRRGPPPQMQQQEDIRDPRRRPPEQQQQRGPPPSQQQQQEDRGPWMGPPQMGGHMPPRMQDGMPDFGGGRRDDGFRRDDFDRGMNMGYDNYDGPPQDFGRGGPQRGGRRGRGRGRPY